MNEKLIALLNGHKQTLKAIYDILESVDQKNPMEGKFQEIFDVVVSSAKHTETLLSQAQQPVAPIGVELAGVRQWTPYEIAIAKGDGILLDRHRFYLDDDLEKLLPKSGAGDDEYGPELGGDN